MSIWLIMGLGLLLELLLLIRGLRARLIQRYYFFYIYIASVTFVTGAAMLLNGTAPALYDRWYWPLQLGTLITGYGILLEILNHVLAPYPGAERFARFSGIGAFGAILCFALVSPLIAPHWSPGTIIEFERDLRSVQAIFICSLLAVVFYYGIGIGRNMNGMIMGYGLYILTSLFSLTIRSYAGKPLDQIWLIQPLSFNISLIIWLIALWSYCPNPAPDHMIHLEEDYGALVARTKGVMGAIRAYIGKAART
ncbi:MAG TPA: hypothetical protein VEJ45_09085 [Candidatus Acidoferrales bacterium]|nr:hypothetical protein [Candidatus Acidoferrales bacterium]